MEISPALTWMITRNCSKYLMRQRCIKKSFTRDENNLTGRLTFRQNFLSQKKMLQILPHKDKKSVGVKLIAKKEHKQRFPPKSLKSYLLTDGPRKTSRAIMDFCDGYGYNRKLKRAALQRASAILKSQRPAEVRERKKNGRLSQKGRRRRQIKKLK